MKNEKKNTEFGHFSALANEWWSKNGKFKILHDIQPIRIKYILEALNKKNLKNTKILVFVIFSIFFEHVWDLHQNL